MVGLCCNVMNRTFGGCRFGDSHHIKTAHTSSPQAELMGDRMIEIALDPPKNADPNMLRVQMDAIKWAAGKMRPAKYGAANSVKLPDDYRKTGKNDPEQISIVRHKGMI
jgi:hypothetical protein